MIRLCLADDQTLVRLGLRRLLDLAPDMTVVAEAGDGEAAVRAVLDTRPDVLLLDVRMPRLDGVGVLEALNVAGRLPPTLMLTTFDDDEALWRSLRAGARGFVLKNISFEVLLESIRTAAAGGTLPPPALDERVVERLRTSVPAAEGVTERPALTRREVELLRLMAGGYSNRELAEMVHLREGTVKNYISTILLKLGVRDRTQAVLRAVQLGLI